MIIVPTHKKFEDSIVARQKRGSHKITHALAGATGCGAVLSSNANLTFAANPSNEKGFCKK